MGFIFLAGFVGAVVGALFTLWARMDEAGLIWSQLELAKQDEADAVFELQEIENQNTQLAENNYKLSIMLNNVITTMYRKDGETLRSRVPVDDLLIAMDPVFVEACDDDCCK